MTVPRFDKADSEVGVHRTQLAANQTGDDVLYGVGLDANGRWVKGEGVTGVIGVSILAPRTGHSFLALDRVDILSHGEIVGFGGAAATVYFAHATTGVVSTTPSKYVVGYTIEADRLVVHMNAPKLGGVGQTSITSITYGTDYGVLVAADALINLRSDTVAHAAADAEQNFKDLGEKLNAVLTALDNAGITL